MIAQVQNKARDRKSKSRPQSALGGAARSGGHAISGAQSQDSTGRTGPARPGGKTIGEVPVREQIEDGREDTFPLWLTVH